MTQHELRDSQWDVVRDTEHHLLVVAGAGTGKTFTVVAKVLYLLGVPMHGETCPHPLALGDLACITYTTRAASELKERLRSELKAAGREAEAWQVDDARIGTLHGFCQDILREFALRAGHAPAAHVLTESEADLIHAETVRDLMVGSIAAGGDADLLDLFADWDMEAVTEWVEQLMGQHALLQALDDRTDLAPCERALVALARRARAEVDERLRRAGAIDFDRMILWTRDLLHERSDVRAALARRLRVLIIDEFQDVDPLQKEIAWLIAQPESHRPDTPRLVLVGDPKQSIYRFRHADVSLWNQVERDFSEGALGRVLPLADNFRSVPAVLGFVDAAIGPLLDAPINGERHQSFEVPYRAVQPRREDTAAHAVEIIVVPPGDDGKARSVAAVRAAEAAAVARRIRELHDAEHLDWGKMALLLRAHGAADTYDRALREREIPTYVIRSDGFYERREVVDLILALQTLRDPNDDLAFMGFLRSPFVGVADETLLALARAGPRPYYGAASRVRCPEQALVARGVALVERFAALRDRIPTDELLQRLLEQSGYLGHLELMARDGLQPLANVRKFLRLVRDESARTVGDLLRLVDEARESAAREGDERLYGETDDVVTITSVHMAKGLEWPVVFWCDLVRNSTHGSEKLLLGRDEIRLGLPELEAKQQPADWQALRARLRDEDIAEQRRLWYVAATRAKDRLILGGVPLGTLRGETSIAAALRGTLGTLHGDAPLQYTGVDGRQYEALVHLAPVMPEPDESPPPEEGPVLTAATLELPPAPIPARAGRGRHSATELLAYARCPRKHWFRYIAHLPEPPSAIGYEPGGSESERAAARDRAIIRGQIVHDVLEHDDDGVDRDALIERAIGRWDEDAPATVSAAGAAYRAEVRREIEHIAADPAYRAVADLPGARHELRFLHITPDGHAVEGAFDLIAPDGEGYVVLDVKTGRGDAGDAEARAHQYGPQRDVYIAAAEGVGGRPVESFAFQFSRAGVQIGGPVSDADRRVARERVAAAIDGIERGAAPLTSYPAECRFCGYRRVGWCPGVPPDDVAPA